MSYFVHIKLPERLLFASNLWSTRPRKNGPVNCEAGFQLKPAKFRPSPTALNVLGEGNLANIAFIAGSSPMLAGSLPKML